MPIFKDVSKMLDYDPKGREKLSDQISRTSSIEDENASKTLSKWCGKLLSDCIHNRGWMGKAVRTARMDDPIFIGRHISPWVAVVATSLAIGFGESPILIGFLFAITFSLFLLFNPHNVAGRWISFAGRVILAVDIGLFTISVGTGNSGWIAGVLIWDMASIAISVICNDKWLMAQNSLRSETVRQALLKNDDTEAMKRWSECGKAETRTVMMELGLPIEDNVIELVYCYAWLCGYLNKGILISNKDRVITRQQKQIQSLQMNAKLDERTIKEMEEELLRQAEAEENNPWKEKYEDVSNALSGTRTSNQALQKKIADLEAQLAEADKLTPEQLLRRNIIRMRENGMTIAEITAELTAHGTKISNTKVGNICKEYKDEKEKAEGVVREEKGSSEAN